jgi:hypothetical protein
MGFGSGSVGGIQHLWCYHWCRRQRKHSIRPANSPGDYTRSGSTKIIWDLLDGSKFASTSEKEVFSVKTDIL